MQALRAIQSLSPFNEVKLVVNNEQFFFYRNILSKNMKTERLNLPTIRKAKNHLSSSEPRLSKRLPQQDVQDQESELAQVCELDKWTAKNYNSTGKKKSKYLNLLYRLNGRKIKKPEPTSQSSLVVQAKLYLLNLQDGLKKVNQIRYNSICKNIEYCSSVYRNFYEDIFASLQRHKNMLQNRFKQLEETIKIEREEHIRSIQNQKAYLGQIESVRAQLQIKQQELQPIKTTMQNIENARISVLKSCLFVGYDVRQEGLIWIIRELRYFPKKTEFPSFLNQNEINYIRLRFEKQIEQKNKKQQTQHDYGLQNFKKSPQEITSILQRKKKREISMIKETEVLQKLKLQNKEIPLKATKYEIIYKETMKSLKKYCINQIHKKNEKRVKENIQYRRQSQNTLSLIHYFESKLDYYMHSQNKTQEAQDYETRQLGQIIRNIRYENYQEKVSPDRLNRHPIGIICCLVGWPKAKKIVQQEMSNLF